MKKGFTLVELLGVIVVLAILALITVPIISNVVANVRINALRDSAYGLVEASNLYYVQKGSNTTLRFDKNDSTDTLKELSYKGVIKQGTVIIDRKGQVTVCITDGTNSAYKNYNETKVTTSKGKVCNIRDNSSIVYLDDEATITQYDNSKLTEIVTTLQNEIKTLKEKDSDLEENDSSLSQQITNLSTRISETNAAMISLDDVYPVGSIYITTTENTKDKVMAKFGGTWVEYGKGRTLVGVDENDSDFNAVEKTGGEKTHTLTESEMPKHSHWFPSVGNATSGNEFGVHYSVVKHNADLYEAPYTKSAGGDQPHNNLQPYITVYMYKRTA